MRKGGGNIIKNLTKIGVKVAKSKLFIRQVERRFILRGIPQINSKRREVSGKNQLFKNKKRLNFAHKKGTKLKKKSNFLKGIKKCELLSYFPESSLSFVESAASPSAAKWSKTSLMVSAAALPSSLVI
jgi:hypothetical protein